MEADLPRIWADERAIRQIVLNLLTNAIKFTPQAAKFPSRSAGPAPAASISRSRTMGRAFQKTNRRGDVRLRPGFAGAKNADEGSGLGLPIVKGLIEFHGGQFLLKSKVREGTDAIVVLPPQRVMNALPKWRRARNQARPAFRLGLIARARRCGWRAPPRGSRRSASIRAPDAMSSTSDSTTDIEPPTLRRRPGAVFRRAGFHHLSRLRAVAFRAGRDRRFRLWPAPCRRTRPAGGVARGPQKNIARLARAPRRRMHIAIPALGEISQTALTRQTEIALGAAGLPNTLCPGAIFCFSPSRRRWPIGGNRHAGRRHVRNRLLRLSRLPRRDDPRDADRASIWAWTGSSRSYPADVARQGRHLAPRRTNSAAKV